MSDMTFLDASVEKDKQNYDSAINILTKLINDQKDPSNKDGLILLYRTRAECHYLKNDFQKTINDLQRAVNEGFVIANSEQYFCMWHHCHLQGEVNKIIDQFHDQVKFDCKWDWYCVVRMLKNLKLQNIFLKKEVHRERSQSTDRSKKRQQ